MYYKFGKNFSGAWTGNLKHFYTRNVYSHSLVSNVQFTDDVQLIKLSVVIWSQYGSVSMWLDIWAEWPGVQFLTGIENFLLYAVARLTGTTSASYPMGTKGLFPGRKVVGAYKLTIHHT